MPEPGFKAHQFHQGMVYVMNTLGDVYRIRMEWDGMPVIEAMSVGEHRWPDDVAASFPDPNT